MKAHLHTTGLLFATSKAAPYWKCMRIQKERRPLIVYKDEWLERCPLVAGCNTLHVFHPLHVGKYGPILAYLLGHGTMTPPASYYCTSSCLLNRNKDLSAIFSCIDTSLPSFTELFGYNLLNLEKRRLGPIKTEGRTSAKAEGLCYWGSVVSITRSHFIDSPLWTQLTADECAAFQKYLQTG